MSGLADRVITALTVVGGSRQEKRQEQLQLDVRDPGGGPRLRQEAYQRERRLKAELLALEA